MSGCTPWTGYVSDSGYGYRRFAGRTRLAHRVAFEIENGPILPSMVIDHVCHNRDAECSGGKSCAHRSCVNPAHLEAVTAAVNNRRGRKNGFKSHCAHGHAMDEANTYLASRGSRECRRCNADRAQLRKQTSQAATD